MKTGHYVSVDGIRTHYFEAGAEHRGKQAFLTALSAPRWWKALLSIPGFWPDPRRARRSRREISW